MMIWTRYCSVYNTYGVSWSGYVTAVCLYLRYVMMIWTRYCSVFIPTVCHDDLGSRPTVTPLRTKLYGRHQDMERTTRFILAAGLLVWQRERQEKEEDELDTLLQDAYTQGRAWVSLRGRVAMGYFTEWFSYASTVFSYFCFMFGNEPTKTFSCVLDVIWSHCRLNWLSTKGIEFVNTLSCLVYTVRCVLSPCFVVDR